jgi:dodecin
VVLAFQKRRNNIQNINVKIMEKLVKVIEVIAASDKGFSDAARVAVAEASKTVKNIKSVYIKEQKAKVENNQIVSYGIIAKISFEIER